LAQERPTERQFSEVLVSATSAMKLFILALLAVPAAGASLRAKPAEPAKPAAIKEKWDKMDEFLEVMFTMTCKWKNGKDVSGAAAEKLKKGEVDGADGYTQEVKDIQAKNVQGLKSTCGFITGDDKKKCRDGCAARWNQAAGDRDDCDERCVKIYGNFEKACNDKADNLKMVYAQKAQKAAAQKQCYEGHCKEFPMVWMKAEEKDMTKEVETQCKTRCTEKAVKATCQKKWAAEIDFVTVSVNSDCQDKSGVKKCFDDKKKKTSTDYDACKKKTAASCDKDAAACNKKGNTDKNFKDAKGFCDDRAKMCQKQSDEKCLADNNDAIDSAEAACEKEAGAELTDCQDKALEKLEKDSEKKCISDTTPTCKKDCGGKCQVAKMNACLLMQSNKADPTKLFCTDFWNLLHRSSEIDPITGNPIALLSAKARVTQAL